MQIIDVDDTVFADAHKLTATDILFYCGKRILGFADLVLCVEKGVAVHRIDVVNIGFVKSVRRPVLHRPDGLCVIADVLIEAVDFVVLLFT